MMYHFFELSIFPLHGCVEITRNNWSRPNRTITSVIKRKNPKKKTAAITTIVVPATSRFPGQETLLSSLRVSLRKSIKLRIDFLVFVKKVIVCSIPEIFWKFSRNIELNLAGQEGLEPPTCGFGDRRSTNSSYWPLHNFTHLPTASPLSAFLCAECEPGNDYKTS